ncbi:MAG: DUF202 domain-containing protein [Candidatus Aenigmatarchaeota archaeon]
MGKKETKIELYEEEQLLLSKERTILSFMRTGLAFVATGIVIASFFEGLRSAQIIGYALVGIGFIEVGESIRRLLIKQREAEKIKKKLERL